MKNIDQWVEWMTRNPELAKKYYPKLTQGLNTRIKNSEPYLTASIIQKLPDYFPYWKMDAVKYLDIKRKKIIRGYIDLIEIVLIDEYSSEIEQQAVESVRAELTEQLDYWNKEIDTRFWLTTIRDETEQAKPLYKAYQSQIESNGRLIANADNGSVKIYTPELAVVLTSKDFPARNMDTQTETTINGWDYLSSYVDGFKEGEQFFENEFKVSPNTLYGANAEQYVRDIHANFFHVKHKGGYKGWNYVKFHYLNILSHKAVKEFGYYSGIVSKVEELIKKHPQQFATFDKCEHELQPQLTETKTDKLREELGKYGFFELSKVIQLSEQNKQSLVELINKNPMPYGIAMFDFLGFCEYLDREQGTKYKADNILSKLFNEKAKDGTSAKHYRRSLIKPLTRYKACEYNETVKTDYQKLK